MLPDTFFCEVSDGKLIDLDKTWVIVGVIGAYLSTIDPDRDRERLENRPWLIERSDRIVDISKGSNSIFVVIFRNKWI